MFVTIKNNHYVNNCLSFTFNSLIILTQLEAFINVTSKAYPLNLNILNRFRNKKWGD